MTNKDESVEKNTESTVEETNVKQNIDDSVEQAEESKGHLQDEAIEETSDENVIEEIDPKDQKINELQQLADENEEKYLRLYAEFENYKRRIQKENEINKTYQAQRVNRYFTSNRQYRTHFKLKVMMRLLNLFKRCTNGA